MRVDETPICAFKVVNRDYSTATGVAHETRHALEADARALLDELGTHPGHSVRLGGAPINLAEALDHRCVGDAPL